MAIYHSFTEAFAAMGYSVKARQPKPEKEIKCRVCGSPMVRKAGTNVLVCTGMVTDEEGKEKPCKNFILWSK